MPSLVAVVVAEDSAALLPACIGALAASHVPALVVDAASRDGSAAVAEAQGARVIRLACHEGFAQACNAGVRAARGARFVLLVPPDATLDPGAADALLAAAARHPQAILFAPRIVAPDPVLRPGTCLMARRDLFLAHGGFDEMIVQFHEEEDLRRRLARRAGACIAVPEAVVRRARPDRPRPSLLYRLSWHRAWSQAYVARKHGLPDPAPSLLATHAARALIALPTFDRKRIAADCGAAAGALAALRGRSAPVGPSRPDRRDGPNPLRA
ncbi:glycosyltransferase [Methylobacterium sp. ID0610]|uniref:glycosyltransferase n=1 Tax=Methylobacterium carpenticola TaxID=3344827 RepID=UPI003697B883